MAEIEDLECGEVLEKGGGLEAVMGEIQHLQGLGAHEESGREDPDAVVTKKQVAQLHRAVVTLEKVGSTSTDYTWFFLRERVLSSLRYSTPVSLLMQLLSRVSVSNLSMWAIFSIF